MDRAYESEQNRQLALDLDYIAVVPPKANRLSPWEYNHALYFKRNGIERLNCVNRPREVMGLMQGYQEHLQGMNFFISLLRQLIDENLPYPDWR